MSRLRIGTRDSQLAVWQATLVQGLLRNINVDSELVYIKSEGDVDTVTPLYALGVQGIFTKTLDTALLNNRIDIAVHSMKDVPTQLATGIMQAAVLKRASYKDILVYHPDINSRDTPIMEVSEMVNTGGAGDSMEFRLKEHPENPGTPGDVIIGTSSVRRIAQWLNRFPDHKIENLRGNVNTRLRKLKESNWHGAIFAAAGLERIDLRPVHSVDLNWMLPAPAQGAIMIVCREGDNAAFDACQSFNDEPTALCTKIEKDFLRVLMGGCSTPISALAEIKDNQVHFLGNICVPDGSDLTSIGFVMDIDSSKDMGEKVAQSLLSDPRAQSIIKKVRDGKQ